MICDHHSIKGFYLFVCICLTASFSSCYSFKGISIGSTIETFYVDQFQNNAGNAPPEVGQLFSEKLKERILNNSRLNLDDNEADIEFTGSVLSYRVESVSPERNNNDADEIPAFGSSINRFSITVSVEYVSQQNEDDNWKQTFTFFEDFENDVTFDQVQDEFTDRIFEQITTDVFNKAFTNW